MNNSVTLPDPAQRPQADVVIWDGQCNFCLKQVQRLQGFDLFGQLAYLSLHDARVGERYPELTQAAMLEQMWVVTPAGEKYGGADAGRYLSRQLPGLWWLAPMLHFPGSMPLWRWLYGKVAERRYRISGKACDDQESCSIHLPSQKGS